jgi:hypothetical protein
MRSVCLTVAFVGLLVSMNSALAQSLQARIARNELEGLRVAPSLVSLPEVTARTNAVRFETSSNLSLQGFSYVDHSITDGQPFDKNIKRSGDTLIVSAGRSGSVTPVDWLKGKGYQVDASEPDLNFAVIGNLVLSDSDPDDPGTLTCKGIALAQGNGAFFGANFWWVYSNVSGSNYDEGGLTKIRCEGGGLEYDVEVQHIYNHDHTFRLMKHAPPSTSSLTQ